MQSNVTVVVVETELGNVQATVDYIDPDPIYGDGYFVTSMERNNPGYPLGQEFFVHQSQIVGSEEVPLYVMQR